MMEEQSVDRQIWGVVSCILGRRFPYLGRRFPYLGRRFPIVCRCEFEAGERCFADISAQEVAVTGK